MKALLYLDRSDIRGGIEIFAERHAAELRAAGATVVVAHEIPDDFTEWDEVFVHKCSDPAALEKFPPEKTTLYVHDHEQTCPRRYAYTPFGRNCLRASGLWPCLLCAPLCRDWRGALARTLGQARRKRAMAKLRRVVVLSQFMKSRLAANGIPEDHIAVEPPRAPVPRQRADGGANPDAGANSGDGENPDMLFVGQLIRGKGVQQLLRAMALMETPRTLDVVGTGNMRHSLERLAEKLGVRDRVRFRGFSSDPQSWMRRAECVVVPSFWQEPYGLVAAEAAALGRPVVAFAIGGLPEACGCGATLVPPGDIAALARALDRQGRDSRRGRSSPEHATEA